MSVRKSRGMIWLVMVLLVWALSGCGGDGGYGGGGGNEPGAGPAAGDIVSVTRIATVTSFEAALLFSALSVPVAPTHDVQIYKIVYLTTDETGALVNASGALMIPQNLVAPAPLLSAQHFTTTLDADVASVPPPAGQPYNHPEALAFGSTGYVTALPDYLGYGETASRFHPYLHARTLAASVVNLLRATRRYCATNGIALNGKLFLAGYSEGGYATMAATKVIQEEHAAEFAITASAPMAGPYDLSTSLNDILNSATIPHPSFVAFVHWAYDRVYALNLLGQTFMPAFAAQLDSLFDGTHAISAIDAALSPDVASLYQTQFLTDFRSGGVLGLRARIAENDLYNWRPTVAMRLIHCQGDDIVAFKNSQTAFNTFTANGAPSVQLVAPLPDGTHVGCFVPATLEAKTWFDTLR